MRKYPELAPSHKYFELNREEQIEHDWKVIKRQVEIDPKLYLTSNDSGFVAGILNPGVSPVTLHFGMFLVCVQKLGSNEQGKLWINEIKTMKKVGCYAQTELGHGSNVAGLETTATLDMATDEFVIHSPTVTSTKFWPGGLGLWANHAVVFAQCHASNKGYGVQAFMVQIRDTETHLPLPGIKVGDIGPKLGYHQKDNGWLMFDKVRIPRTNMLARFAYIHKDGKFEVRGNPKALYQTMVEIRYQIIAAAGRHLKNALIIGMRYAVCRR